MAATSSTVFYKPHLGKWWQMRNKFIHRACCCGKWVHMQTVEEERNEYRLFLWFLQYGTRGKCPSLCCKDFFMTAWIVGSCLCLIFSSTVQSILWQSNNMWQARQMLESWSELKCWVCCLLNCVKVHLAVWLQGANSQTQTSWNLYWNQTLDANSS